ncbi:MAG TPA: hypothetical protein VMT32_20990 [Bryobacteraceae bacterium]|nr:hypothetical protein [Bryobacteraceae bacterium]
MERRKRQAGQIERATSTVRAPDSNPTVGGQAGDLQGLPESAEAESQSVRELAEEGQAFEAAVTSGVENAPDADVSEVTTSEVPEDDVPSEYLEKDPDAPKE